MSARELPNTVVVGKVLRPHGIRGEVAVEVMTDTDGRFAPGCTLEAAPTPGAPSRALTVESSRGHGDRMLVRFVSIDDRDQAGELRGWWLEVERQAVPPSGDEDTWYFFELVGCQVVDKALGDLGRVVDVLEDGGGLLLDVADPKRRVPIPLVREFLVRVDVLEGVIETDLPDGLVAACASTS